MSDNVTPLFQQEEQPQEPQKKSLKAQWIIFIFIVTLIIILLSWFLLSNSTALDGVKRFFRYLGTDSGAYGSIHFDAYGNSSYALAENSLVIASQGGLSVYSDGGRTLQSLSGSLSNPMLDTADDKLLLYDVGGTRFALLDSDGDIRFDMTVGGRIFDADLSENGTCAVLYEGSDCCAVLDVYNSKGAKLYTHRSGSSFLNTCALSPDGSYAVVSTLGQEDISFLATARILTTRVEGIKATLSFGTQVICDMAFLSDERICAVGEDELFFFDVEGKLLCHYTREDALLSNYCFGEDYIAAVYDRFDLSLGYELLCLDENGKITAELTKLPAAPQDLSISGNYLCLLNQNELSVYDNELKLHHRTTIEDYVCVLCRSDGTAVCIGSSSASLYIP